jgi:hypothetical protein
MSRRRAASIACAATACLLSMAAPAAAKDGVIGSGGQPPGGTDCSQGACTYVALGTLAGRAPANGTLTSFTFGHGPAAVAATVTLDVFDSGGGGLTLVRQSSAQSLPAGAAGSITYDLSGSPLEISGGQVIGVTVSPSSGYAPAAVIAAGNSSNSSLSCDGVPLVGQSFNCSSIALTAHTVALSAFFLSEIRPPTVAPQAESGVGPYGATLHGLINPNGAPTTATLFLGEAPGSLSGYGLVDMGSGTSDVAYSQEMIGLQPSTTYYYKVAATNETDTTFGSLQSFVTSPAPPQDTTSPGGGNTTSPGSGSDIPVYTAPTIPPYTAGTIAPYTAPTIKPFKSRQVIRRVRRHGFHGHVGCGGRCTVLQSFWLAVINLQISNAFAYKLAAPTITAAAPQQIMIARGSRKLKDRGQVSVASGLTKRAHRALGLIHQRVPLMAITKVTDQKGTLVKKQKLVLVP